MREKEEQGKEEEEEEGNEPHFMIKQDRKMNSNGTE